MISIVLQNHYLGYRESLAAQLQLAMAKADSENLGRSIAEEQLSDVEKEKTMLELEIKEQMNRHKSELSKKEHVILMVTVVLEFLMVNYEIIDSLEPKSRCNDRILNNVKKVTFALVYQQYISSNLRLLIGEGAKDAKIKCGQKFPVYSISWFFILKILN